MTKDPKVRAAPDPRVRIGAPGSAGRVIAGVARGRRLAAPGPGTRPLSDRVKQSLFAIIEPDIRDRAFLDLFAGSGAGGIEALSRGAERVVFVENHPSALHMIERNLRTASLLGLRATIVPRDVIQWLTGTAQSMPFAGILVDPPYEQVTLLERSIDVVAKAGPDAILAADGVLVAKHFRKTGLAAGFGLLRSVREERFGETALTFYRWTAAEGDENR